MFKINSKRGYTLIELLVVIAIIAILIGVGTASYQRAVRLSRDSKRKTDLEQIRQALETYRSENGVYPATDGSGNPTGLTPNFISTLPTDPRTNLYIYVPGTPATTYSLCASLEFAASQTISAACSASATQCGQECNYEVTNP